jgi:hypothetical protein
LNTAVSLAVLVLGVAALLVWAATSIHGFGGRRTAAVHPG